MIDSGLGWGGCNAGRAGVVYNSPKHRGALDCLPFQGSARRSGIEVFMSSSSRNVVQRRFTPVDGVFLFYDVERFLLKKFWWLSPVILLFLGTFLGINCIYFIVILFIKTNINFCPKITLIAEREWHYFTVFSREGFNSGKGQRLLAPRRWRCCDSFPLRWHMWQLFGFWPQAKCQMIAIMSK